MMTEHNIMLNVYVHMGELSHSLSVALRVCASDIRANFDFVFLSIAMSYLQYLFYFILFFEFTRSALRH